MPYLRRPELLAAIFVGSLCCTQAYAQSPDQAASLTFTAPPALPGTPTTAVLLVSLDTLVPSLIPLSPSGTAVVPGLAPGPYRLSAGKRPAVTIDLAPSQTVDIRLTSTSILVLTSPDADPIAVPDQDADGLASRGGLPSTQNAVSLDGANLTQAYTATPAGTGREPAPDDDGDSDSTERAAGPAHGLARGRHAGAPYVFAQASIRDFRASTEVHAARPGILVARSSVPGTAAFHGSIFATLRSQALAATEPLAYASAYSDGVVTFGAVKPHDLTTRFGGALTGPLIADQKLYLSVAVDAQRRNFPVVASPADPAFYRLTNIQRSLLTTRGVNMAQVNTALNYLSSLTGPTPRSSINTIGFARLDWLRHARANLQFSANIVRYDAPAGLLEAPVVARARASLGNASGSVDSLLLRLTSAFSPHLVNTFAAQVFRNVQYESPQPNLPQEPLSGASPQVNLGPGGFIFGTPASLSFGVLPSERRVSLEDAISVRTAQHYAILGVNLAILRDDVANAEDQRGSFLYDSGSTGGYAGGLVDFITDFTYNVSTIPNGGCPNIAAANHFFCFRSFTQTFGQTATSFSTNNLAAYASDNWRVTPRLTLTAGLRYDYTLLPIHKTPTRP